MGPLAARCVASVLDRAELPAGRISFEYSQDFKRPGPPIKELAGTVPSWGLVPVDDGRTGDADGGGIVDVLEAAA